MTVTTEELVSLSKKPTPRDLALKEDELKMTKQDVLEMFDGLVIRWKKYPNSAINKVCIATTIGFKTAVRLAPEKVIQVIWSDILKFFNKLIIYNQSIKGLENNDQYMKITFEKFKQEIKEGNFD